MTVYAYCSIIIFEYICIPGHVAPKKPVGEGLLHD